MKYQNIQEESLKLKVAKDYFYLFDYSNLFGNIDFCVCKITGRKDHSEKESLFWAEAKKGNVDLKKSIVQLILTIGKARTFDKFLPPPFLGAFDSEKILFIPYNEIQEIFYLNDFNWKITPSNHKTREFEFVLKKIKFILEKSSLLFYFGSDDSELKSFIKRNLLDGKLGISKIKIDKNNYTAIYSKWLKEVKPSIAVDWEKAKKIGIIDGDFYLADLLSNENKTLKEKLFVLLNLDHYELDRKMDEAGMFHHSSTGFIDNQISHFQFWNKYDRPPKEEYWEFIISRRDLLVPQDIRERKGSFFTPQIWVELAQKYLSDVFGENWQDEYYIWDCAAGTGNLLVGLTNKYNIWASTLDIQDVEVMYDRIKNNANLLESHVFQFDFLNDDFSKLPESLQSIIYNQEKRKRLIIFINPPYAEVSSMGKSGKKGVNQNKIHDLYHNKLSGANRELYAQFLIRIYYEINGCNIGEFSTIKTLLGAHFETFRKNFQAKLLKIFLVPGDTFDNVKGKFPIGFKIWDTGTKETFDKIDAEVFNEIGELISCKSIQNIERNKLINNWISTSKVSSNYIGFLAGTNGNDFQHNNIVYILNLKNQMANPRGIWIDSDNLIKAAVYFAVRKSIPATWLNDRDQFLFPKNSWETDYEFQNDCLIFTLFNNNIQTKFGINHWIPYSESEVNSKEKFESNFMSQFIKGKLPNNNLSNGISLMIFEPIKSYGNTELIFSNFASEVYLSGMDLWKYYHSKSNININASFYEIKEFFQGRNEKGKMNTKSLDETYNNLIQDLKNKLILLARKIEPKVYEHGFLL